MYHFETDGVLFKKLAHLYWIANSGKIIDFYTLQVSNNSRFKIFTHINITYWILVINT